MRRRAAVIAGAKRRIPQQIARPTSTFSASGWSAFGAATAHEAVNEAVAVDTSYVQSGSTSALTLGLPALQAPDSNAPHVVTARLSVPTARTVAVALMQGATVIATRDIATVTSYATYTYTLTTAEVAAITDYTALRLRIAGNANFNRVSQTFLTVGTA